MTRFIPNQYIDHANGSRFANVRLRPNAAQPLYRSKTGSARGPTSLPKQNPRAFKARGFLNIQQGGRLNETLTLGALPSKFASATHSFCFLASLLFRWLFKVSARLHFTEQTFTLHLLLEGA